MPETVFLRVASHLLSGADRAAVIGATHFSWQFVISCLSLELLLIEAVVG